MKQEYELFIGSHVGFNTTSGLYGSVKEAVSYKANALMVYLGAPQNTIRKPLNEEMIVKGHELMRQNNITNEHLIVHAPYVINLCSAKQETRDFSVQFLIQEVYRVHQVNARYMVLHPGSALTQDVEVALDEVVKGLNQVLSKTQDTNVVICLETMAGKGSEVGINLEQMNYIYSHVEQKERLGFCLDTCHLNDAGYDMSHFDEYIEQFKKYFDLSKIKVIHLNDSKNPFLAHKDRHANLGHGYIGFDNLLKIAYHPALNGVTKILETPWIKDENDKYYCIYKEEIQMLRDKKWFDAYKK